MFHAVEQSGLTNTIALVKHIKSNWPIKHNIIYTFIYAWNQRKWYQDMHVKNAFGIDFYSDLI